MKEKIKQAYNQLAEKYNKLIDHKPHNAYYDRPNTLGLVGNVTGKKVLDAACGPGKYAEILLQQGAEVTGFDFSPEMVKLAQERNGTQGSFFVHDLSQPLPQLPPESFDVILCALAFHYIKDWQPTLQEFCRLLKAQGKLVISIEHPFFEYNYYKSSQYFATEPVKCTWTGFGKPVEINSYRRSLHDCIVPITNNGFYIDQLIEPKPVAAFEQLDPKHYQELNQFPAFMCLKAVKRPTQ
jgi:ubiquinone/menaquinone biosynthesis C-methylase UbiE